MTAIRASRMPTLWHGQGITRPTTSRLTAGRDALVLADSELPPSAVAGISGRRMTVQASALDAAAVVEIAQEIVRRPPDVIVAVGGGSVLDASKIAALALARGHMFDYAVEHASRSALTLLPDSSPPVDIIAVPTTLGTSSETNSVGVLRNEHGYRLMVGRALRPRHAIIDAGNLITLPPSAVKEGAMEAFLRLAGASTGSRRSARGRRDAVALGAALLESTTRDSASIAGRLRIARLSATTQRCAALRGQDPYSARHWYAANEVAFGLGVRKMVATAAIIAAVWRRIRAGDPRWGDRESLEGFWTGVAGTLALPPDPPDGITALVDRWEIPVPPRPTDEELARISVAIAEAWGNGRPMLRGLSEQDFRDVLRDSRWSAHPVGGDRRPSMFGSKEVK